MAYAGVPVTDLVLRLGYHDPAYQAIFPLPSMWGRRCRGMIYENGPGWHEFGRLDTKLAKESRHEVYKFLAGYLKPERPVP